MAWIAQAGVGVIVYSWWGQGSYEYSRVMGTLNAANAAGVKVAWHLEPYANRTAASTVNITVSLGNASKAWFQSADSQRFGGQFGLVQSFQWQGQPTVVLNSVSVSLTNAQGASAAVLAKF
jgi:hypothetical protein